MNALAVLALAALANAPPWETCPYCGEDPQRMAAAGVASHGPFDFGTGTSADVERLLPTLEILWTETAHFKLGTVLRRYKLGDKERKKVRAELERLQIDLPEVEPRTRYLDPWLRSHLYAQRVEDLWLRFLEVVGVDEKAFPAAGAQPLVSQKYMGQGPHLGQKSKFELLILPTKATSRLYLSEQYGLPIERTQRWNDVARDSLTVVMNLEEAQRKSKDEALHGHVVFNLTQNLIDGYKHYNYDTPLWYHEGLAHALEREISPHFNSFDGSEGALAKKTHKSDWLVETRKLLRAGEAPRLAELTRLREYAQFELEHHFATWSMVQFLLRRHPQEFACFLDRMHGVVDENGSAIGDMQDHQRASFKDCLELDYAAFDRAWREWLESADAELAQQ